MIFTMHKQLTPSPSHCTLPSHHTPQLHCHCSLCPQACLSRHLTSSNVAHVALQEAYANTMWMGQFILFLEWRGTCGEYIQQQVKTAE